MFGLSRQVSHAFPQVSWIPIKTRTWDSTDAEIHDGIIAGEGTLHISIHKTIRRFCSSETQFCVVYTDMEIRYSGKYKYTQSDVILSSLFSQNNIKEPVRFLPLHSPVTIESAE